MPEAAEINVTGIVQGVGFRPFIYRIAKKTSLKGYVKNLGDAGVEIKVEGSKQDIEKFLKLLEKEKPVNARIDKLDVNWAKASSKYNKFSINLSGGKGIPGTLPPDISICDKCIKEITDKEDRRYRYPFTSCTDCGPRFTTIRKLPYDRENTAFSEFPQCPECSKEYTNPEDRRFHAQTNACPSCGPQYTLTDNKGRKVKGDIIREAVKQLREGRILTIKGMGGMHIASTTTDDETIKKLRKKIRRLEQPFAIMSRDLRMTETFAEINEREKKLISSREKPIVVLKKKTPCILSELLAPGLDSIGVMLPYMGIHYLLLSELNEPMVMTSANYPGEPMITENNEAGELGISDFFLLHNLEIINRCDDSVIKQINKVDTFLRRSRGYVPLPIKINNKTKKNILGVGPEINSTACFLRGNEAFLSQYIGNTENLSTARYLEQSARHLIRITDSKPDKIACDLHPAFYSTRLGLKLSMEYKTPLVKVQHHIAHLAAIQAEFNLEDIIGICIDGAGYGLDEKIWGGEIILSKDNVYRRVAHLQEQDMPGGDTATYYPSRMLLGILHSKYSSKELEEIAVNHKLEFKHGREELRIVLQQLEKNVNVVKTTSTGRVLDSAAALLGVCFYRSYEGEPAMKLDSLGSRGRWIKIPVKIEGDTLNTTEIVARALELKEEGARKEDIAYSVEKSMATGLATLAVNKARENDIKAIGLSGGVAYNNLIVSTIAEIVNKEKLKFLQHRIIPPGDGCISLGQVKYATEND